MNFSCIALFRHTHNDPNRISQFEERVLIVNSNSENEAEQLFLAEIKEYAVDGTEFLGEYKINEMYPVEGRVIEVTNSMKVFSGSKQDYINKHWSDQRPESCELLKWQHAKYKIHEGLLGCYNCNMEFEQEG